MNYTKGTWEVGKYGNEDYYIFVDAGHNELARVFIHNGEQRDNAHLIAAAVNACASVNPDNPLAVADSIKPMYEAIKCFIDRAEKVKGIKWSPSMYGAWIALNKALDKADGKEGK